MAKEKNGNNGVEKTIRFQFEKATKNTIKFEEVPEAGQPPIIGSLYVQKWAVGEAKEVTVVLRLS